MRGASGFDFPHLENDVRQALRQWHGDSQTASPLAYLYLFRQAGRAAYHSTRQATNQVLFKGIEMLGETHEEAAQLLQMRFLDSMPISQLANKLNVAESTVFTQQRQAIHLLADAIRSMEWSATHTQKALLEKRLPAATYVNLVGVDTLVEQLIQTLATPQPPWVVSIEGIGGIGKTSLADALVRQLIQRSVFDETGWVSAQQTQFNLGGALRLVDETALSTETLLEKLCRQLLPSLPLSAAQTTEQMFLALQTRLKEIPHLIVIDNLETLVDVESLLPTLQRLVNPTKFLLTSRQRITGEPSLYHIPITELSQTDALRLVRQEAALSNLPVIATSSDAELLPIVATVGGNPLAIRLVVGQTHIHSLETILADLRAAQGQTVESLYTFIYRVAWDSLDNLSQRVLLLMPLASPQGDDLEYLAEVSGLAAGDVRLALNHLVRLNLVDARGGLNDRRYSIHSLTRTFLQRQVAKWQ